MKRHSAKPLPKNWFFKTSGYRVFMVRELTSVFLGGYLVFLIVLLRRAGDGAEPFAALLEASRVRSCRP